MNEVFYKGIGVYYRLEDIPCPNFVVNVDRGLKRFFLNFTSLYHFEKWYANLHATEKTINEVIMSDTRKLIIDIDDGPSTALHIFDFERHVSSRINQIFTTLDIGFPEVIIYNMVDESGDQSYDKLSYHVVVSNFSFSAATCKGLCMILSSGQVWENCVDLGIYKTVQCIRMEGSTKFGEKRWKQACGNNAKFQHGLVSNIGKTIKSEFTCNPLYCKSLHSINYSLNSVDMSQFKIAKKTAAYVSLYRIKPGYCNQCNRVHYRENAAIRYIMGQPTFICWRYATSCS